MPYLLSIWPLLLCPVAMGVMMWVMMRGMSGQQTPPQPRQPFQPYDYRDQRLRPPDEVVESLPTREPVGVETPRSMMALYERAPAQDQYDYLTARLAEVEQQQRRLARELAALDESGGEASTTAVSAYAPARGSDA